MIKKEEFAGENLRTKISTIKTGLCVDYEYWLDSVMDNCKSPTEKLMAAALYGEMNSPSFVHKCIRKGIEMELRPGEEVILKSGGKYRTDFSVSVVSVRTDAAKMYAIECGEYDFVEKDQPVREKRRARDLIAEGYVIIRFAGSEIYKRPLRCAREAIATIFHNFLKQ